MATDLTSTTIRGYEFREEIGAGGFGVVYRAYQPIVGREVAIKIILPEHASQPDFVRRFETEAQLVARLEHPHIVPLFDYWRDPTGAFLVMRLLRGGSLRARMDRGLLPQEDVVRYLEQIAGALAVAHRLGVVHRDIKPQNILLDEDGQNAYLTDFGIAKVLDEAVSADFDEEEGISGSPAYLAPEQIRSEPITAKADIYGLGVIIYELLTGDHPFPDSNVSELIFRHLQDTLPDVTLFRADLPPEVNDIIQKATAKDPDDRYPDVITLAAELRRVMLEGGHVAYEAFDDIDLSTITNPYKGLRPFDEADAADFFGREALVARLIERMKPEFEPMYRFLAVVGPSGSGKSSVVKAGLIPALRWGDLPGSESWFISEMVPGAHPLENLAEALLGVALTPPAFLREQLASDSHGLIGAANAILGGTEGDLLLVVDQFEEVFTQADEREREQFIGLLATAATTQDSRVRVVVTLRADFTDRPLQYPALGALMRQRTEFVLPLTPDEIERAVTGPAERVGLHVAPGLLAAVVAAVREEPGALPLLQYALTEVFARREPDSRVLTLEAYQESGGVLGALARRAEELYAALPEKLQFTARQMFLRLITLGEGTQATRRRVAQSELSAVADAASLQTLLDTFGGYRLLSFDRDPTTREPTVEIAHEALIREWKRLRDWLENSRDDLRMQRLLNTAAGDWARNNRDTSFLLTGSRLTQFAEWSAATDLVLTADESAYLKASIAEQERREASAAAQQAREKALERRSRNILYALLGVFVVATVVALGLTVFAFQQQQEAEIQRANAVTERAVAEEQRGIADLNALTAQQAATQESVARATSEMNAGIAQTQVAVASTALAEVERSAAEARSVALAALARQVLDTDNTDLALALALEASNIPNPPERARNTLVQAAYAPGTRRLLHPPVIDDLFAAITTVAVRPGKNQFMTATGGGFLTLYDGTTGEIVQSGDLYTSPTWINDLAFTPDGKFAVIGIFANGAYIWDVDKWQPYGALCCLESQVSAVAVSPDGRYAVTAPGYREGGGQDLSIILWDLINGTEIRRFTGHKDEIQDVDFSPDGKYLLSTGGDDYEATGENVAILWDVETGEEIRRVTAHIDRVDSAAFSPDGLTFVTGSKDETAILWDVETGEEIRRFTDSIGGISTIAFSEDGGLIIAGTLDGIIYAWNTATGELVQRYLGQAGLIHDLAVVPNSGGFLSTGHAGDLRWWYLNSAAELRVIVTDEAQRVVVFSPDGSMAMTGSLEGSLTLWDAVTWEPRHHFDDEHTDTILTIAFSPDGTQALTGDYAGGLILWDLTNGKFIRRLTGHSGEGALINAVFSPDGTRIASMMNIFEGGTVIPELILWDAATYEPLWRSGDYPSTTAGLAFTPDGQRLVVGSYNLGRSVGEVIIHDAATGEVVARFNGHTDAIYALDISPDGTQLLTSSGDLRVILWDITPGAEGRQLRSFIGHTNLIQDVKFSPDGRYALSASWDATVRLWDLATGEQVLRFDGHTDRARSVAFMPDGTQAVSAGMDKMLRLWQMPMADDALAEWVNEHRYVRELTCDERAQYGVEPLCEPE